MNPAPTLDASVGRVIAGRYRIVRLIAMGGMGAVFEAETLGNGERVAVKLVRSDRDTDVGVLSRFLRETGLLARIDHENVVRVIDAGQCRDDGALFLVQELLDGRTLDEEISVRGPLPVNDAYELLIPVMRAVGAAHSHGIIHRDLKPGNVIVMRTAHGIQSKLIDFGLAKHLGEEDICITAAGTALGTAAYMAPEQVRGAKNLDARIDVWAMGVMWFEALAAHCPFQGATDLAVLTDILLSPIPRIEMSRDDIDPVLASTIHRALERDAWKRFATMDGFRRALEQCRPGGTS